MSYDSVDVLAHFAEKYGITYPLLSDVDSRAITDLGLLNQQVFEQHAVYGIKPRDEHLGVPYPGVFVLDQAGTVVEKRFQQSYRDRETGAGLIEDALGVTASARGAEGQAATEAVQIRAYLDSPTYSWFQRLRLTVEVAIAPGYHVYGAPSPADYVPLSVEVEPIAGVTVGEIEWPAPRRWTMTGLDEECWVHEGTFRRSLPLVFSADPGAGDQVVRVAVSFQACSDEICLPPETVRFELPVHEVGAVERSIQR